MILHWCAGIFFLFTHINLVYSIQLIDDIYNELNTVINIDKNELYKLISQAITKVSDFEGLPNNLIYNNQVYDLSNPCPNGWALSFDSSTCIRGYYADGKCPSIEIKDTTPSERISISSMCVAPYQFSDTQFTDYSELCPKEWRLGGRYCISPENYGGKCVKLKDFHNLTEKQRLDWSIECGVRWPKFSTDYESNCPHGWIEDDKFCHSPADYAGTCEGKISKDLLKTLEDKLKFVSRCNVNWPIDLNPDDLNTLYDDYPCPIGWKVDTNLSTNCIAPLGYSGPCGSKLPLVKSHDEKVKSSKKCGFRWYKMGVNHSLNVDLSDCPFGWTLVDNLCVAPPSYNGPCQITIDMSKFTMEMKLIWAQVCDSYFLTNETPSRSLNKDYDYRAIIRELKDLSHSTDDMLERVTIQAEIDRVIKDSQIRAKVIGGSRFIQVNDTPCNLNLLECPYGWINLDGIRCLAPYTYRLMGGECPDVIVPSVEARKRLHLNNQVGCNVHLPCRTCIKDYVTSICPINWHYDESSHSCIAPKTYPSRLRLTCGDSVQFKYATPTIRRQWEMACEVEFPCASTCMPDYTQPCPKGFKLKRIIKRGQFNIAMCKVINPKTLLQGNIVRDCLGPNGTINILLDRESKKLAQKRCNISWPCASRCNENFWQACPYDWILVDGFCISPRDYTPPDGCPLKVSIESIGTPMEKFKFSLKCHAKWPCVDSCQQDFTRPCPQSWIESDDLCLSNSDNECGHIKISTIMERQEFSFRCRVAWPCGGSDSTNPAWQAGQTSIDSIWESREVIRFYS